MALNTPEFTLKLWYFNINGFMQLSTSVTDANGEVTEITTTGSGLDERVYTVTLPDGRYAEFGYDENGFLNKIVDMGGFRSDLEYGAKAGGAIPLKLGEAIDADEPDDGGSLIVTGGGIGGPTFGYPRYGAVKVTSGADTEIIRYNTRGWETFADITRGTPRISAGTTADVTMPYTTLTQAMTTTFPGNTQSLPVANTEGFPDRGWVRVINAGNGWTEDIHYNGKTTNVSLNDITRGSVPIGAPSGSRAEAIPTVPYLSRIVTPSGKVDFEYDWFMSMPEGSAYLGLRKAFEYGPSETRTPEMLPTWYFYHTAPLGSYVNMDVTHYPASTGGLTKTYYANVSTQATEKVTDEAGNVVIYEFDGPKNLQNAIVGAQLPELERRVTHYTYNADPDPEGLIDDMASKTDPELHTTTYEYENHRVKKIWDASSPSRLVYQYDYNSAGQVENIWTEAGSPVKLAENHYDAEGRLSWSLDGRGKRTDYHYDETPEDRGFLTSVHVEGQTNPTLYTYDDQGRKKTITDPEGRVTRYVYDNLDRVVKVIYPDNTPADPNDNPYVENHYTCCHLDWKKDENGRTTYYHYDNKNRVDEITDSATGVTKYVYDSQFLDRVIRVQDPKQSLQGTQYYTQYDYYDNGKLKKITYADSTWEEYEYNVFGEMTKKTDSEGRRIDYQYDKNGRLIRICPL